MKHIFIVNPAAGAKNSDTELLPELTAFLKNSNLDYEIHQTLNKGEIGSYVRQRASENDSVRFYACGGDGTICDVVNGMYGFKNAEMSIYPCGSGNDFARNFTNKKNFLDFRLLTGGHTIDCDVVRCNDRYSVNMLNIGVDCDIVERSAQLKSKLLRGSMSYLAAAANILPQGRSYNMSYEVEGETYTGEFMLAAIANGQFCGGGFRSSPLASLSDGFIDVTVVKPVHGPLLLKLMAKYRMGTHLQDKAASEYINHYKCKAIKMTPLNPVKVSVDGEVEEMHATYLECIPNAIRVAIPNGCEVIS